MIRMLSEYVCVCVLSCVIDYLLFVYVEKWKRWDLFHLLIDRTHVWSVIWDIYKCFFKPISLKIFICSMILMAVMDIHIYTLYIYIYRLNWINNGWGIRGSTLKSISIIFIFILFLFYFGIWIWFELIGRISCTFSTIYFYPLSTKNKTKYVTWFMI